METLTLNVSGKIVTVGKTTINRFPNTRLGRLSEDSKNYDKKTERFFFDRNSKMILPILDLYRTGELHLPCHLCPFTVKNELDFWEIPEQLISECCWKRYSSVYADMKAVDVIEQGLKDILDTDQGSNSSIGYHIWMTMEYPTYSKWSKMWFVLYIAMVLVAVITACLSVSPELRMPMEHVHPERNSSTILDMLLSTEMNHEIYAIDIACLIFFALEILVRFTVCPQRLAFFKYPLNILDLVLTVVMLLSVVLDHIPVVEHAQMGHTILRAVFSLNILRVFHIGRTSKQVKLLIFTITASIEAFALLLVSMTMAITVYASLGYFAEVATSSDTFENIPIAIWWAVVTMTTVGYGDYAPKSWPGYIVGIICALSGILLLALPIAIIASNFNTYYSNMSSAQQRMRRKMHSSKKELERMHSSEPHHSRDTDSKIFESKMYY